MNLQASGEYIMEKQITISNEQKINDKIYTIRCVQVMLDSDLAEIYGVESKRLNEQVKRNLLRFPEAFRFQLTEEEFEGLRSQIATLKSLRRGQHRKYLPYVFTEQGVSMLSAVLKSKTAVEISIKIINSFVSMRNFLRANGELFQRLESVEKRQIAYEVKADDKFERIFNALENKTLDQKHGVFFEGQVFDAYVFVSKLIKQAKKSIILIDNYIDESVLMLLSKRAKNCAATIYTKNISKKLSLDLKKHNEQYARIEILEFKNSHDRFLILDEAEIYHIGASLKDLGKKWFAFSRLEKDSVLEIFKRLKDRRK